MVRGIHGYQILRDFCELSAFLATAIPCDDLRQSSSVFTHVLVMAALYGIGQAIIFSCCGFYLLSIFYLFSSPNLSGRRLDVHHTSTHGVALVQIYNAGLKRAARGWLKIQDTKSR